MKLEHEGASAGEIPADIETANIALVGAIEADARRRLPWERWFYVSLLLAGAVAIADIVACCLGAGFLRRDAALGVWDWVRPLLLASCAAYLTRRLRRRALLARLEHVEEPERLGILLDAHAEFEHERNRDYLALLSTLLKRVRPGDEGSFTPPRLRATAALAESEDYPHDLRMAALSALRHVADERAAARVATIANARVLSRHDKALRRAARSYLPEIRARLNRLRGTERLLRPAEPPREAMLPRPARGAVAEDKATLVKPVEVETDL